jgi:hypothetical protein
VRVFVSYASRDRQTADELRDWLVSEGHVVFLDRDERDGIVIGEAWESRLYDRLLWADVVVCLVTSAYLASQWCTVEVGVARSRGRPVLPVLAEPGVRHPLLQATQYANYAGDPAGARAALRAALDRMPRPLPGRRWWPRLGPGLAASVAAVLLLLGKNTPPPPQVVPPRATVIGPGCAALDAKRHDDWDTHADWTPAGGDYTGPQFSGRAGPTCGGQSFYVLDQRQSTALFRWHVTMPLTASAHRCDLWAYIPTQDAGDRQARYDFYADDATGQLAWLGWPGHTVDQENTSGWTPLGGVTVPARTNLLTVILDNQDPSPQRWYAGAGDLAFACR